ncbi:PREDICTED: eukaryotic elongation factor 2 kinase-like [Priapulus caudatus]|uniref:Eukaryotic elongation factor 2 kinase-like n=1 Tax=Priapulus caudatus TaxID=37621 RepID=A0ABM1ENL2_PRICU|nr:PREDICTED: eukaryotic elongation factor 2 kinase-like [Priapulus caudatus]
MVHLDLAKYHEMGRFKEQDGAECDMDAAMFHLKQAVNCEVLEAIQIMAKLYLNMPTDIFSSVQIPEDEENIDIGVGYMHNAADAGDRQAMIHLAKAYDTGVNLGSQRERDWKQAVYWYDRAIHTDEIDAGGEFDSTMDDPMYMLMSCEAELWRKGGLGLTKDPSYAGELYTMAADNAMESMKGRLANKFYALAEEAWAEVEEPEE